MSCEHLETRPAHGLFVCGTGTDVGKTYVSCEIAKKLVAENISVGVYKPVASGAVVEKDQLVSTDALALQRAAACDDGREIRHAIGRNPVPGGASGDLTRRLGESQRPAYMRLPIAVYCIAQSNRI